MQQKTKDNATHTETNNKITTVIFMTWYRTFREKNAGLNLVLLLAEPRAFFVNVKYTTKMTTLHDRNKVVKNAKKHSGQTQTQINNSIVHFDMLTTE